MKKLLFLFTTILLPMITSADESGTCGDNLTWTYVESTKTLTISGSGDMTDFYKDGRGPIIATPWYNFRKNISIIVIEDGVTSIGGIAFSGCKELTSVTIGNSVKNIGSQAFSGCI